MVSNSEYGVFAPLLAVVSAIMAAGCAIVLLWAGRLEKWRPADADLPGMAKRTIVLASSVVMVMLALKAEPMNLPWLESTAIWLLVAAVVIGIVYPVTRRILYHSRVSPNGNTRVEVLGGLWMKMTAKETMKAQGISVIDDLLDGMPGPEAVWSDLSRALSRVLVLAMFMSFVITATSSLISAGLIVLVHTTKRALF